MFSPLMAKESLAFTNGDEGRRRRAVYDRPLSHVAMPNYFPGTYKVNLTTVSRCMGPSHRFPLENLSFKRSHLLSGWSRFG